MSDLQASLLTIGTVLIMLIISEGLATMEKISKENARKLIHISVGNVVFFVPLFDTKWLAVVIPILFVFGNYLLSPMSPIEKLRLRTFKAGHAWGTILYPLSLGLVILFFFDKPWLIVASFFPVVYGDGFAAVFGPYAKSGKISIHGTTKSLLGSSIVSLFSWLSSILGILILGFSFELAIIAAGLVGIIAPFIELLAPKGTDNFILPMTLSIIFALTVDSLVTASNVFPQLYIIGIGVGLVFAIGGYFAGFLTWDGAITGFMINTYMFGIGGLAIGFELFLFFILGSGATKVVRNIASKTQDEFEKGSERRDALQALAKAGLPAFLSYFFIYGANPLIFYFISGIMCAALIDTLSTEVGIATRGTPIYVLTPWRRAKPGQTGVISLQGTLGGMGFGLVFIFLSYFVASAEVFQLLNLNLVHFILVILIAGTVGMLMDSIFGATLQRRNMCQECKKIVESRDHHGKPTIHRKGLSWFNNDVNNFLGTACGGLGAVLLYLL